MRLLVILGIFFTFIFPSYAADLYHPLSVGLSVVEKKIKVNGVESTVFAIEQSDGTLGLRIFKKDPFDVRLKNTLSVPTSVHWHGLIPCICMAMSSK